MDTSTPNTIKYASYKDYINRRPTTLNKSVDQSNNQSGQKIEDSKVEISEEAKSENVKNQNSKASSNGNLAKNVVDTVVNGATKGVIVAAKAASVTNLIKPKISETQKAKFHSKAKTINKPGIFFISGMQFGLSNSLGSSSSNDTGLKTMSEYISGAEHFKWDDKDELLAEIEKRPTHQPIIMVGHSLGGDLAVEVANELNNLSHGFRKVDLIVTLDSVGFNNDIIPQNVRKNLNFIGEKDFLYNDGPNIPRDTGYTKVTNELRSEAHTELDDSYEVQFKIFENINNVLLDKFESDFS